MTARPVPALEDYYLEVARGNIPGHAGVNKFGRNPDIDTGVGLPEDIWTRGGIWVPPTAARIHDIAGGAADTAAGTGMRTVRIFGLQTWDTAQSTEDVTLNGTTPVATANSYVIIHRMFGLTFGSSGTNSAAITATARSDGTVTAEIGAGFGQTLMAIYGIPSTKTLYLNSWYCAWARSGGAANEAGIQLYVKLRADQSDSGFVVRNDLGLFGAGNTFVEKVWTPPTAYPGPAIVKVQCETVSANNTDIDAGFDGVLVDN